MKQRGLVSISKRNLGLLLLLSLALTGTLWALLATPFDGPWTGTNNGGRAVTFTTSGTGTAWTSFSYAIQFFCPTLGGNVSTTITQSGPGAITDGAFSYSSSTLAFTGSFSSPTSASGTYTLTAYPVTHGVPFPPYVHTDYVTHSGTWTAAFSGVMSSVVLISPNGGEAWAAGSAHDITWTSAGEIANVALEYSANGGTDWTTIVGSTPNSGSYPWTIPGSPSTDCLVRVSHAAAPSIFDVSDAAFSIIPTIPASERQALIDFYDATAGDLWSDNHGWKTPPLALDGFAMPGTEETWAGVMVANSTVTQLNLIYNNLSGTIPASISDLEGLQYLDLSGNNLTGSIPPELGSLTNLSYLSLYSNQLSGSIPSEIGSLTNLQTLMLFQNQLSGPIPAALGGLSGLFICHLGENQLSGPIPAALSGLTGAQQIVLSSNRLTGPIPAELGGLTGLTYLYLNGNQLSGSIPTALTGMVSMEPGGLNLGYNALYASNPTLVAFLNTKNPGWASTQTITPTEITATALDGARILVSWLPIAYTADAGSYRIFSSVDPGGPYSFAGQTADKSAAAAEVSGLTPGETYYFVVRAHTDVHANNPNAVESEDSSEASAVAWTRINPRIAGIVRVGSSPLPGVVMSGLAGNPVTDSNGAYDVTVAAGWSGTVTPTLAGYTFDPAFRTYSVVPDDQSRPGLCGHPDHLYGLRHRHRGLDSPGWRHHGRPAPQSRDRCLGVLCRCRALRLVGDGDAHAFLLRVRSGIAGLYERHVGPDGTESLGLAHHDASTPGPDRLLQFHERRQLVEQLWVEDSASLPGWLRNARDGRLVVRSVGQSGDSRGDRDQSHEQQSHRKPPRRFSRLGQPASP